MWYGLKENEKLIKVSFIEHYPTLKDFRFKRLGGKTYAIVVVVRVREVCLIS